jgi:hypothetical protein
VNPCVHRFLGRVRSVALAVAAVLAVLGAMRPLAAQTPRDADAVARALSVARAEGGATRVPDASEIVAGGATIAAGARRGGIVVANGTLDVAGEVDGDAVALFGDVIVRPGGHIRGAAVAVGGRVRLEGGRVDGDVRSLAEPPPPLVGGTAQPTQRIAIVAGGIVLALFLGLMTAALAGPTLDQVAAELERGFGRALLVGFLGMLGLGPALAIAVVALVLSIIGILLVPFALVAYVILVAGMLTLGLTAVARVIGTAVLGAGAGRRMSASSAAVRGVLVGLPVLLLPWGLALVVGATWPAGETLLRIVAAAVLAAALTAGFGATLLSRTGRVAGGERTAAPRAPLEAYAWQTPTPITGIAAARRPTATQGR